MPMMPSVYAIAVVITPSAMTGTTHDIVNPATTVSLVVKRQRHHAGHAEQGGRDRADDQSARGERDRVQASSLPSAVTSSDIMK